MTTRHDRIIGAVAVMVVIALALVVVLTVLDAERQGRQALERNQRSTLEHLAASMNQRVRSSLEGSEGFGQAAYTLRVGDPADQAALQNIQDLIPKARSGLVLIDESGTLTAGTLLREGTAVGSKITRAGLDKALRSGQPTFLPSDVGLTTSLPAMAVAVPIQGTSGTRGVAVFETVVAADSDFNKEIAELRQGSSGRFTFVDERGTVIVSSEADLLGNALPETAFLSRPAGLTRLGDRVVGIADVPAADWRLIFTQDANEFEAGLGQRVHLALLLMVVGTLLFAAIAFIAVLRRLRGERAERQRIEEVNATREEFISIVSHELRTPVAGVLGFLESTLDHWETLDEPSRRASVIRATANARRLQSLTRDVLDTTHLESGTISYAFDIVDIVSEVSTAVLAEQDAQPGRPITFTPPATRAWVRADPDRVQQVLLNLLENATKHTPASTPIDLSLELNDDHVTVSVRDMGPGIFDESEQLFDKWVRGRDAVRGTGLGLYISRRIVEAHHGRIWAENAPTGGAMFRFTLPLMTEPVATVDA